MTISEMIKKLEALKAKYGDLRVTVYDDYTANEGWDYKNEDLWLTADAEFDMVIDEDGREVEKVIRIY